VTQPSTNAAGEFTIAPIPPPELDWVQLRVFGAPGVAETWGPVLELAVLPGGGGTSAFVSLFRGRFSAVLLGRVAFGVTPLQYVAVKLARDNYVGEASGGIASPYIDNREVADMWEREKDALLQLQTQGSVRPLAFEAGSALEHPTVYCEHRRVFFRPIDPDSAEPLQPLRDPEALAALGLAAPERSLARYLSGPAGGEDARPLRAYTWSTTGSPVRGAAPEALVAGPALFERWSDLVGKEVDPARAARLESSFPCWFCSEQRDCYAARSPRAPERIGPLTFYGGPAIVTPALPVHVDEAAALCGGALPGEVLPAAFGPGTLGRQLLLFDLDRRLRAGRRHAAPRGTADFAREALFLRLDLLRQVAGIVHAFHATLGRPVLDVSPGTFMVDFAREPSAAASLWTARVRLVDAGAQHRFRPADPLSASLPSGWLPSLDVDQAFLPWWIPAATAPRSCPMNLTVGQLGDARLVDRLDIRAKPLRKGLLPDEVLPGDFVHLRPESELAGIGSEALIGVVVAVDGDQLRLRIHAGRPLGRQRGEIPVHFEAEARFHARLGPTADLYGFAVLGFRVLLHNDCCDALAATEAGRHLLDTVRYRMAEARDHSPRFARATARALIAEHPLLSDPRNVVYHQEERDSAAGAIDVELWADLLETLARAGTLCAGYGYAGHRSDYADADPGATFARIEGDLEQLSARARCALAAADATNRELDAIVAAALRADGGGDDPLPAGGRR
jgi:hypothetical protein